MPYFSKAVSTVSLTLLTEKLIKYGLDKQTGTYIENWHH